MRDALSLADQAIAYGSGAIEEEPVRRMLGAVDRGHAVRIVEAIAAGDGRALVAAVDGLRELGLSAAGTLEELAALLQDVAIAQAVPDSASTDDLDAEVALRLSTLLPADETQLLYSIVLNGRAELPLAPDEYSGLVMVLLRMLAFPPRADAVSPPGGKAPTRAASPTPARSSPLPTSAVPSTATATPSEAVAAPLGRSPLAVPAASPIAPVPQRRDPEAIASAVLAQEPSLATSSAPSDRVAADRWAEVVQRMIDAATIGAMVRELAMQAECLGVVDAGSAQVWRLRVERENLRTPALRERLQTALADAVQGAARIEIEAGVAVDSPAERQAIERRRRQAEAEKTIHDDPLVKALLAQYKTARVVPGSVKPL